MKRYIDNLKYLSLLLLITSAPAYACDGCMEREYSVLPWGLGYIWLLVLATVMWRIAGSIVYSFPFLLGGIFVFLGADGIVQETKHLYCLIVFFTIVNFLVYFLYTKKVEKEKKYNAVSLFVLYVTVIPFIIWLLNPFPLAIRPKYLHCQGNLEKIGEALKCYKEVEGHYPIELQNLTPGYMKKIPRCITQMKPDSLMGRYYKTTVGLNSGDYGYEVSIDLKSYTLYCKGRNHKTPGYPQYTGEKGIDPVLP